MHKTKKLPKKKYPPNGPNHYFPKEMKYPKQRYPRPYKQKKKNSNGMRNLFSQPSPALLAKFGLTLPPPADLGPDRRADLLPVL
eukprot:10385486-Ditylum_brightwellii.AAC.1